MTAFSMMVRKPEKGDPRTTSRIRADASSYLVSAREILERESGMRSLVEKYRREMEEIAIRENAGKEKEAEPQKPDRKKVRTKRDRSSGAASLESMAKEREE